MSAFRFKIILYCLLRVIWFVEKGNNPCCFCRIYSAGINDTASLACEFFCDFCGSPSPCQSKREQSERCNINQIGKLIACCLTSCLAEFQLLSDIEKKSSTNNKLIKTFIQHLLHWCISSFIYVNKMAHSCDLWTELY